MCKTWSDFAETVKGEMTPLRGNGLQACMLRNFVLLVFALTEKNVSTHREKLTAILSILPVPHLEENCPASCS